MIAAMGSLGLRGMAGAFDEAVTTGVQRKRTVTEILTDLLRAEAAHRRRGSQHVLALQETGDPGLANRQRAEHQGPVADRLVARNRHPAAQCRGRAARLQGQNPHLVHVPRLARDMRLT